MGWWDADRAGMSFAQNDDTEDFVWGDSPADVMDDALAQIAKIFEETWERKPTLGELRAGLEFSLCAGNDTDKYGEDD